MRKIIYSAAASLDGYIARSDGSVSWIPTEPEIDFAAMFGRFDTILMGRKTYEISEELTRKDAPNPFGAMATYVFSRGENQPANDKVKFVNESPAELIQNLRVSPGKDIWLMGGGELASEFLAADLIDGISIAVCPVLLGAGIPMFSPGFRERGFKVARQQVYAQSGIVAIDYERF